MIALLFDSCFVHNIDNGDSSRNINNDSRNNNKPYDIIRFGSSDAFSKNVLHNVGGQRPPIQSHIKNQAGPESLTTDDR